MDFPNWRTTKAICFSLGSRFISEAREKYKEYCPTFSTINIESTDWSKIYSQNVLSIPNNKIKEFKYKLLTDSICTRNRISKWNKSVTKYCQFCQHEHTVCHLLFECNRINHLWTIIGTILKMNITYKHIVVGNSEVNDFITQRNLVISYVAYGIYKMWIQGENDKLDFANVIVVQFIKKHIFQISLLHENNIFRSICDKLITAL